MMDWRDQGLLLSTRRHGESSAIIEVLTSAHGRHAGIVRGGASSKMGPVLQPGAQLDLEWRARLSEHLGTYRVEPLRSRAGVLMSDRRRLAAFNAVAALLLAFTPEREPDTPLYDLTLGLADALADDNPDWAAHYAAWELGLLGAIGFQLDLGSCAATGATQELVWVSPKSGRAVSRQGGEGWEDRLLPLPAFLKGAEPTPEDVHQSLRLTGHFLTHWVLPAHGKPHLPEARGRFLALLGGGLGGDGVVSLV
ncbi:MAG: DNA repair protein RecO [Pseudomonadota bacterium]